MSNELNCDRALGVGSIGLLVRYEQSYRLNYSCDFGTLTRYNSRLTRERPKIFTDSYSSHREEQNDISFVFKFDCSLNVNRPAISMNFNAISCFSPVLKETKPASPSPSLSLRFRKVLRLVFSLGPSRLVLSL